MRIAEVICVSIASLVATRVWLYYRGKRYPKPNSMLTKVRRRIANYITPLPEPGKAWCVNCTLNNRKTMVFRADRVNMHMQNHKAQDHAAITMSGPLKEKTS